MIVFRVDGNEKIGLGHVMRCLSYGMAARELGIEVCFIVADETCTSLIGRYGMQCEVLGTVFSDMESEVEKLKPVLEKNKPASIVIDSYYVTKKYLKKIRGHCQTVYIDDRAEWAYPVDILVNYNIFAPKLNYKELYSYASEPLPKLLLGTEYTPLRTEFRNLIPKKQLQTVQNVLVSTGGADAEHIAINFLKYLRGHDCFDGNITFHFVLGAMNTDIKEIKDVASSIPNVVLHQNVIHMQKLMMLCDVAVSAAGSTLYELCACGIPTITYVLADNQIPAAEMFEQEGIMLNAGDYRVNKNFLEDLFMYIKKLCTNYDLRLKMYKKAEQTVCQDGALSLMKKIFCMK